MDKIIVYNTTKKWNNSRQKGHFYEKIAKKFLQSKGLIWIATNVVIHRYEIDIIMRDQQQWVFVEVRYRKNDQFGCALSTITRQKKIMLVSAAIHWLSAKRKNIDHTCCRFDILSITGNKLYWVPNAFSLEECRLFNH